jgi:hypothetical protein
MPLFTKSILAGVAALLSIPVFGSAIIGANYPSPILFHLIDVIQGQTTTTVASTNAPNWGLGLPMSAPLITSIATSSNTSAASGLASSTPYVFQVAALDGTGTTTLVGSATITTDASTTQHAPEDIVLKWAPVNGATGYAIFFGTSTIVGSGLTQYFLATTSGQFTFSTSTGSRAGSNINQDTTAFSGIVVPSGATIFNDSINTATSSKAASTTALQVNGTAVMTANGTPTACMSDTAGAVFFNQANKHQWGCDGTNRVKIF